MARQGSIFSDLSENEFRLLYGAAKIMAVPAGKAIIRAGEKERALFIIAKGKARVIRENPAPQRSLAVLEKGNIFGETSFFSDMPSQFSLIAAVPSHVMKVDHSTLLKLPDKLQLYFYKRLHAAAKTRVQRLSHQNAALESRNVKLADQHFNRSTRHSKEIQDSVFINEVVSRVPRLPVFAVSLTGDLASSDLSHRDVADQVKKDPSLTGMILKRINSSYYSLPEKISDLHHAIMLLGFNTVSQILMTESVKRALPDSDLFQELYHHSIAVSSIAFELSLVFGVGTPTGISTMAVLHELGQIVIQLLKQKNKKLSGLFDLMDHPPMTKMLLKYWGLPAVLYDSLEYQSYPEFTGPQNIPDEVRENVTLLFLSHLCNDLLSGKKERELPMIFYSSYMKIVSPEVKKLPDLVKDDLLPRLVQKKKSLPVFLRNKMDAFILANR